MNHEMPRHYQQAMRTRNALNTLTGMVVAGALPIATVTEWFKTLEQYAKVSDESKTMADKLVTNTAVQATLYDTARHLASTAGEQVKEKVHAEEN